MAVSMGGATSLDAMRRLLAAFLAARRFSAASTSGLFGSGATARLLLGLATPGGQSARSAHHIAKKWASYIWHRKFAAPREGREPRASGKALQPVHAHTNEEARRPTYKRGTFGRLVLDESFPRLLT